jgi:hypothetical protein
MQAQLYSYNFHMHLYFKNMVEEADNLQMKQHYKKY